MSSAASSDNREYRERMSVICFAYLNGRGGVLAAARLRHDLKMGRWWDLEYDAETDTIRNPYAR